MRTLHTLRTIGFIIQKEILQVLRDKVMLVQIFVPPILQLLIIAQAMTYEIRSTNLALIDLDASPTSSRLVAAFTSTGRFDVVVYTASADRADDALLTREASAILRIPEGFGRAVTRRQPSAVQLVLNAEDGAAAGIIQGYAGQILTGFSEAEYRAVRPIAARPITIQTQTLYNAERDYLGYMAIGLLASLVTLVGILLTSQNIAREKEIGTLEQLNVTPITKVAFIAGKLIPFLLLGLLELTLGLLLIRFVFGIPFLGSVGVVYVGAFLYLLAALGLGLLVSTVVSTQQQAMFITFFVLVTFFFLGGIFTPAESMPGWAQTLSELNPIKHFVTVLRVVLMKGGGFAEVSRALGAMSLFAVGVLTLAARRYQKTTA